MGQTTICPCVQLKNDQLEVDLLPQLYGKYRQQPYNFILQKMQQSHKQKWSAEVQQKYRQFLKTIANYYNNVPYHNLTHAFDVTIQGQAIDKYIVQYGMKEEINISEEQHIYILIAAYAHDNGHQGLTNHFYIDSQDPLALKYSNLSPLEHMHSSNLLECIRYHGIQVPAKSKELMVNLILATDNKHHFQLIQKIKQYQKLVNHRIIDHLVEDDRLPSKQPEVKFRQTILEMMIHTADINCCGKPVKQYLKWNQRLYEQFKTQYSKQSELKIKHNFQFDLNNWDYSVAKSNLGFINGMILPLFKEVQVIMPKFRTEVVNSVKIKEYFQAKIKEFQQKQKSKTKAQAQTMKLI